MKRIVKYRIAGILLLLLFFTSCKENTEAKAIPAEALSKEEQVYLQESMARGKSIYMNYCASCHMVTGEGIANAFPPLDNSDWLQKKRTASISAVKHGLKGVIEVNGETFNSVMVDLDLSDQEVADVMNYIMNSWSNQILPPVTLEEVKNVEE